MLPDVASLEVIETVHHVDELDELGLSHADDESVPDLTVLLPLCRCGAESCHLCSGFQMTPRTALALWATGQVLADQGYDDVEAHGDEPVLDLGNWTLFDDYPPITWRQNAVWRRQAARAFNDLTAGVASGELPRPAVPRRGVALHLVLQYSETAATDGLLGIEATLERLPTQPEDLDWEVAHEVLFQDTDILDLFDLQRDGIEDPDDVSNRTIGMGDYRPPAWFTTFTNATPRDADADRFHR